MKLDKIVLVFWTLLFIGGILESDVIIPTIMFGLVAFRYWQMTDKQGESCDAGSLPKYRIFRVACACSDGTDSWLTIEMDNKTILVKAKNSEEGYKSGFLYKVTGGGKIASAK